MVGVVDKKKKILIIRLSSFGDIFHGLSVPAAIKKKWPEADIHWVVRNDFAELLEHNPLIDKVWIFNRKLGLLGWLKFIFDLRKENFTHIYDAHNNTRSLILRFYFQLTFLFAPYSLIVRSKSRLKRLLLFKFGKNFFPRPFYSQHSFLKPLQEWDITQEIPEESQLHFSTEVNESVKKHSTGLKKPIALAPSAAWKMKRWPVEYWKELIQIRKDDSFIILGGPTDTFCQEIADVDSERVTNMAGKLKLIESCAILHECSLLVSADTGVMHAADLMKTPCIALIGPSAFGYPASRNSHVLEVDLPCKPCSKDGRGKCVQDVWQKCMVDITVDSVDKKITQVLS